MFPQNHRWLIYLLCLYLSQCKNRINPSKIYSGSHAISLGKERSNRSCIFNLKQILRGWPTVDDRENRWESPVGYRRCMFSHMHTNKHTLTIELATHYINRSCNVDCMKTDVKLIFIWESKIVRWNRILAKCRFFSYYINLYEKFTPIAYSWEGDSDTPKLSFGILNFQYLAIHFVFAIRNVGFILIICFLPDKTILLKCNLNHVDIW